MPEFCPKCHTQAYDDTSFFCYRCGAPLGGTHPQKITGGPQKIRTNVPEKKSCDEPGTVPVLPKASPIHLIEPIEICAQCGGPIADKNRIFCKNCGANIREVLSGEGFSITKQSVYGTIMKAPIRYQIPELNAIKEPEPALIEKIRGPGPGISSSPKVNKRKSIFILAVIAILFFILMLTFLLIFP